MGKTLALLAASAFYAFSATAGPWQIETVDQAGAGKFTSLKIDKDGNAHVAYVAENDGHPLKYGFWDHNLRRWFFMTVAEQASFCSLVLDSHQRPHISWADFGVTPGAKLHYAYWDGNVWKKEAIPLTSVTIGYYTSLVLDASDRPSISFYEYDGPRGTEFRVRLRVVSYNGRYWEVRTVDGDNQSGKFNSLAIDSHGVMHVFYANVNALTACVRDAFWNGSEWKVTTIDDRDMNQTDLVGYSAFVAADNAGSLHAAYMNYSSPALKYAFEKNGVWTVQVVDRLAGVGYPDRTSITFDPAGIPYISYFDAGLGVLKLAHREGGTWRIEAVDGAGAGFTSSVQISHGQIWISYADEPREALKVARRPLAEPAPPALSSAGSSVGGPSQALEIKK